MAYQTPNYDYGLATNQLTSQKGLADFAQDYGRFLGQQRYRRGLEDANRTMKDRFPRVGSAYNRRGIYNSGLRREGQRNELEGYQRAVSRMGEDQATAEMGYEQARSLSDAQYQQALLSLYEQLQRQRAAGFDPFATIGGVIG